MLYKSIRSKLQEILNFVDDGFPPDCHTILLSVYIVKVYAPPTAIYVLYIGHIKKAVEQTRCPRQSPRGRQNSDGISGSSSPHDTAWSRGVEVPLIALHSDVLSGRWYKVFSLKMSHTHTEQSCNCDLKEWMKETLVYTIFSTLRKLVPEVTERFTETKGK